MLAGPMPWHALLSAIVVAGLTTTPMPDAPATPDGINVIPPETGVTLLPEVPTLQAVAGDVDGDGARELVRLVRDADSATLVEVWHQGPAGWVTAGDPAQVLRSAIPGIPEDDVYAQAALRLLVWYDGARERVLVASQPRFELLDVGPACCLLLHEVALTDAGVALGRVAEPTNAVHALLMLDLNGDGADELLATRSLGSDGPIELRISGWDGEALVPLAESTLPSGAPADPFVLGESDGLPGEEAGVVDSVSPAGLSRISLNEDGEMRIERSGLHPLTALASDTPAGPVLVTLGPAGLEVHSWPAGGDPVPLGFADARRSILLGVVAGPSGPAAALYRPTGNALQLLTLPELRPPAGGAITRSVAAGTLFSLLTRPYVGPVPGGGPHGEATILFAGRFVPPFPGAIEEAPVPISSPVATLAGAWPIGLLGDGSWMGIQHADVTLPPLSPDGGPFASLTPSPGAWLSIAPLTHVLAPELDDGSLEPPTAGLVEVANRRTSLVDRGGFTATVEAPAGSRIVVIGLDPSVEAARLTVRGGGEAVVSLAPPTVSIPNPHYRSRLVVLTPAGHGYVATWNLNLLNEPPRLEVTAETPLGSGEVTVRGATAAHASVQVNGRDVATDAAGGFSTSVFLPPWPSQVVVEAVDPVGNRASTSVSGVGFLDYRGLPWIPIAVIATLAAAVLLYLRVPHLRPLARRADDDAALEELDPD